MTVLVKKDNCGWVFKVKCIGPQNKEEKASDKASDVTIRQCPGSRVQPGRETKWTLCTPLVVHKKSVFSSQLPPPPTHTH